MSNPNNFKMVAFGLLVLLLCSCCLNILVGFYAIDRTIRANELERNDRMERYLDVLQDEPIRPTSPRK